MQTHRQARHPGRALLLIVAVTAVVLGTAAVAALLVPQLAPLLILGGLVLDLGILAVLYVVQVRRHW